VTPSFKPPLATFDFEDSLATNTASHGNTGKVKKGKKPKKGSVALAIVDRKDNILLHLWASLCKQLSS